MISCLSLSDAKLAVDVLSCLSVGVNVFRDFFCQMRGGSRYK